MASNNNSKRGLASASKETRQRVSKAGGSAHHTKRGRSGSDGQMSDSQMSSTDQSENMSDSES
jgi:hypothetical protein